LAVKCFDFVEQGRRQRRRKEAARRVLVLERPRMKVEGGTCWNG